MNDALNLLFLFFYFFIFLSIAFFSNKLNLIGRVGIFTLLFYSVSPFFEFSDFQFFNFDASYIYDPRVTLIYSVTLVLVAIPFFLFFRNNWELKVSLKKSYLYIVWFISIFAWLIDVVFNWSYFSLPKNEYILSIPDQTKNLIFFTIPAKEILVSFAFFPAFGGRMRKICIAVALAALFHSVFIGVRHIAFVSVLLFLLPRVKTFGFLIILFFMTFAGEASNVVKLIIFEYASGNSTFISDGIWINYIKDNFGVSLEQKAILTNLIIKMNYQNLFEFGRLGSDLLSGIPMVQKIIDATGYNFSSSVSGISDFVGVMEGQGTAYSIQLALIESLGSVVFVIFFVLFVLSKVKFGFLYIVIGEFFYSMMRNGVDYWFYQFWKIIILVLIFEFLNKISEPFLGKRYQRGVIDVQ